MCARLGGLAVSAITLTQTAYTPAGESPEHLRVELAVAMAGFAADALTGQMQPVRGGDDLRVAAELAGRLTPDPHAQLQEIGTALERALAALTAHRPALHELAWTIERQGEIRGYGPVALALTVALAQRP